MRIVCNSTQKEYELVVARRPITMTFLYVICKFAYNEPLYDVVRRQQGMSWHIDCVGEFSLSALTPLQDLAAHKEGNTFLFSELLTPVLGYKPELLSWEMLDEQYLSQTP